MFRRKYESEEDLEMKKNIVIEAKNYDFIDGRNAYKSKVKKLTLENNKNSQIVAKMWEENVEGELEASVELAMHQVLDLMILLSHTLLHFHDAYRLPLLYDPEKEDIYRVGLQGGVMPISVCTENVNINEDIKLFSQALSDSGELTGERLRIVLEILEKMR